MECTTHKKIANRICQSCGKAICEECTLVTSSSRSACSQDCLENLNKLDEAATITVTKSKKSLKANVTFSRLVGATMITVGILTSFMGIGYLFITAFSFIMGVVFIAGAQIFSRALK